jgi:hypothetical protein
MRARSLRPAALPRRRPQVPDGPDRCAEPPEPAVDLAHDVLEVTREVELDEEAGGGCRVGPGRRNRPTGAPSSHRTCGFPASGGSVEFTGVYTQ